MWALIYLGLLFKAIQAEDFILSIRSTNDTIVHVPNGLKDGFSITLALHGLGDNYPDNFQKAIGWDTLADETREFVSVYPLGSKCIATTGVCGHTWNGGQCCLSFEDDETFLDEVIEETISFLRGLGYFIDLEASGHVFLLGFSAGAVMSHRMACRLSGKISAIAAVSGTLNFPDCQPEHPISILNIHGTLDPLFPWYGGLFSSIPKTVDSWLRSNNCNLDKIEENSIALGIEERKWTDCIGNTTLVSTVKIDGGFHAWPPKRMLPEEFIWKFFKSSI